MTAALVPEQRLVQVRDVETDTKLSRIGGMAVPYNDPTDIGFFVESFAPGSLDKSIKESAASLPLLLFHDDRSFPIGTAEEWKSETDGLHGVWRLDGSETAQRAAQLAKDGMLGGFSIRFQPVRSDWTYAQDWAPDLGPAHKDSVIRVEARLVETSLLSTPAYQKAGPRWVRTGEQSARRTSATPKLDAWARFLETVK